MHREFLLLVELSQFVCATDICVIARARRKIYIYESFSLLFFLSSSFTSYYNAVNLIQKYWIMQNLFLQLILLLSFNPLIKLGSVQYTQKISSILFQTLFY